MSTGDIIPSRNRNMFGLTLLLSMISRKNSTDYFYYKSRDALRKVEIRGKKGIRGCRVEKILKSHRYNFLAKRRMTRESVEEIVNDIYINCLTTQLMNTFTSFFGYSTLNMVFERLQNPIHIERK